MEAELEALLKAFDAASDAPPEEADRLLAKPYSQLEQRPHSVVALIASHRLVISKRHDVFQSPWPRRYSSPGKQPMPRESREPWMAQLPAASVPRGRSLMQFDLLMRVAKGHYCKWGESMNHGNGSVTAGVGVSPHFFRQHKHEKSAVLTPTPAVADRLP